MRRPECNDAPPLGLALAHSAEAVGGARALVVWERTDRPEQYLAIWTESGLQSSREEAGLFCNVVASSHRTRSFAVDESELRGSAGVRALINPDLVQTFSIQSAVTAPFEQETCRGRLLVCDKGSWREEDIRVTEAVAFGIGVLLHEQILCDQRKRTHFGRDLHDGVLQGLTAAIIHLKVLSERVPADVADDVATVRRVLEAESRRVRVLIEEASSRSECTGVVELSGQLTNLIEEMRQQWRCSIDASIQSDLVTSFSTGRNVGHMVSEAISNAVRHGGASNICISISQLKKTIFLSCRNDGR